VTPEGLPYPSLIQNLLLIHGWGIANQLAWNYPSWSVSTEWAGYLLFPALWFGIASLPAPFAAGLAASCLPVLAFVDFRFHSLNLTFAWSLLRFFPEFILGIATAKLLPAFAARLPARPVAALGLTILLLALHNGPDFAAVAGLWAMLAAFAVQAESGRPGLLPALPFLRFLGRLSYAFYMSFGTIELFLAQLYRHQGWDPAHGKLVYALAMTTLTLLLALSLHSLIETPARLAI
jgi:peptidoglycan/LPS O-acetylase OafA/YrhL